MREGKIIVLCAPSGTGKSTLMNYLKKSFPQLMESISTTTRKPREEEKEGVDYFYLLRDDFLKKIDSNYFIEWAYVHGNYYGTSREFVEKKLKLGRFLIFDIDIQGAEKLKAQFKDKAKVIFIAPPSLDELEERLRKRGTESEESIALRLKNAREEMKKRDSFDFVLVNNQLELAKKELLSITERILKE